MVSTISCVAETVHSVLIKGGNLLGVVFYTSLYRNGTSIVSQLKEVSFHG